MSDTYPEVIVSVKFKGKKKESAFIVNGYTTNSGVLKLVTYVGTQTKIQIFPLLEIEEININGVLV